VIDQETGEEKTISVIEMRPWKTTVRETLEAAATFAVPEDQPKHGGSQAAVEAREQTRRGCEHEDADVIVNGICAAGGEDLGDRRLTAEEWAALKDQVALSGLDAPPVYVQVLMGDQVDLSAPRADDDARAAALVSLSMKAEADPGKRYRPEPVNLGAIRRQPSPWQCRCGSYKGHAVLNGDHWKCEGCGNVGGVPPAMKGAEE
jgi:hypothetical protein